jgi:S1-C subfamily serine protease
MSARIASAFLVIGFLGTAVAAKGQAPQQRAPGEQRAPRATLGVMIDESQQTPDQKGAVVRDVDPAGPAAKAGMKPGDVIVRIEDKDVANFDSLRKTLADHKAGDKLSVTVMRDGKEKKLTVTLAARRPRPSVGGGGGAPREGGQAFLGIMTQPLNAETKSQFNVDANEGVVVTEVGPGTPASKAGIRRGDVITKVDGKAISNPDELRDAMHAVRPGQEVTLSVARGGKSQEMKVRPEEASGDLRFGLPPLPGGIGRPPFEGFPTFGDDRQTIQRLEQRIQELEKRVHELEKKRGDSPK